MISDPDRMTFQKSMEECSPNAPNVVVARFSGKLKGRLERKTPGRER
jgi:hypothetical protein